MLEASSPTPQYHICHRPRWLLSRTDRCQTYPGAKQQATGIGRGLQPSGIPTTTALLLPWGSSEHHMVTAAFLPPVFL